MASSCQLYERRPRDRSVAIDDRLYIHSGQVMIADAVNYTHCLYDIYKSGEPHIINYFPAFIYYQVQPPSVLLYIIII